jgi:hypothetical protein
MVRWLKHVDWQAWFRWATRCFFLFTVGALPGAILVSRILDSGIFSPFYGGGLEAIVWLVFLICICLIAIALDLIVQAVTNGKISITRAIIFFTTVAVLCSTFNFRSTAVWVVGRTDLERTFGSRPPEVGGHQEPNGFLTSLISWLAHW